MKRIILLLLLIGCAQSETMSTPTPEVQEVPIIAEVPEPEPVPEVKVESPKTTTHKINILDYEFSEPTITIKSGDKIEWTQQGQYPHTVTETEGPETFGSEIMRNKGETYSHTYTKKGTYRYKCDIHPAMRGVIIVE